MRKHLSSVMGIILVAGIGFVLGELFPLYKDWSEPPQKVTLPAIEGAPHPNQLAICCSDWRFHPIVSEWMKHHYGYSFDFIARPGTTCPFQETRPHEDALAEIEILVNLHHLQEIHLFAHYDCGGHGGAKKFESREDEIRYQTLQLLNTRTYLARRFPLMTIHTYFVNMDRQVIPIH